MATRVLDAPDVMLCRSSMKNCSAYYFCLLRWYYWIGKLNRKKKIEWCPYSILIFSFPPSLTRSNGRQQNKEGHRKNEADNLLG